MQVTEEELQRLAAFVHKQTGVFLDEEKLKRYKRKIETMLERLGFTNFSQFYHQIRFAKNQTLMQELFNTVTVNETYFWREHEQFEFLVKFVFPKLLERSTHDLPHIRILVLPSSSGEEVYSIMLALLDDDDVIHRANVELVGVDIDSSMIEKARRGIYSKRSVAKLPKALLQKYFTKRPDDSYEIAEELRRYPKFLRANIFDTTLKDRIKTFDIVFSRNMLIYFLPQEKQKAFGVFYSLLRSKGYLFLGHADANGIDKTKFARIKGGLNVYEKIA